VAVPNRTVSCIADRPGVSGGRSGAPGTASAMRSRSWVRRRPAGALRTADGAAEGDLVAQRLPGRGCSGASRLPGRITFGLTPGLCRADGVRGCEGREGCGEPEANGADVKSPVVARGVAARNMRPLPIVRTHSACQCLVNRWSRNAYPAKPFAGFTQRFEGEQSLKTADGWRESTLGGHGRTGRTRLDAVCPGRETGAGAVARTACRRVRPPWSRW
jgi:hypothetical protein